MSGSSKSLFPPLFSLVIAVMLVTFALLQVTEVNGNVIGDIVDIEDTTETKNIDIVQGGRKQRRKAGDCELLCVKEGGYYENQVDGSIYDVYPEDDQAKFAPVSCSFPRGLEPLPFSWSSCAFPCSLADVEKDEIAYTDKEENIVASKDGKDHRESDRESERTGDKIGGSKKPDEVKNPPNQSQVLLAGDWGWAWDWGLMGAGKAGGVGCYTYTALVDLDFATLIKSGTGCYRAADDEWQVESLCQWH
eukprot:Nk52_evm1s1673 gene=Nk52_evmTU1s1673